MLLLGVAGALVAAAPTMALPPAKSLLQPITDSYIRRGAPEEFGYSVATLYTGIQNVYELTKNETIGAWYRNQIDAILTEDGEIINWDYDFYSLDEYRIGNNLLYWYDKTGEQKYKTAADTIHEQLLRHPRNPSGGFWHRQPNYPNQMWLDGIFMADTFYGRWTSEFNGNDTESWDDIALQYDLIEEHCREPDANLLVHGYDESKVAVWADPVTGAAPLVWSRAVGWYYWSLTESIALFPKSHPGHARLVKYFVTLSRGLKEAYESDEGWWLIMTQPYPRESRNYIESSAFAMFTYGVLHGLRVGLLSEDEYGDLAADAYKTLTDSFVIPVSDGLVDFVETVQVGSLSSNGTYEYYVGVPKVKNDYRGGGALLAAAHEWELRTAGY